MRRARIIHVLHRMGAGGTELALRRVVAGLDPDRFEHIICTVAPVPENELTGDIQFVSLHRAGKKTGSLVSDLARLFLEKKPDIVHSRNWGAIEAVLAAKLARVPRIIHSEHGRDIHTMHGDPWRRRVFRRFCYALANEIFAVSRELREHYARQTGIREKKINVIPNGVDTGRFRANSTVRHKLRQQTGADDREIVVGSVGRLDPVKDYATLLQAAGQAITAGAPLKIVLVGDGSERERLQTMVDKSLPLRGRVVFAGESNRPEDWLNSFDVFVLPSLSEGMSNTVLEAMATELPSIVTSVGANPDLVHEGATGFLIQPRDADALSNRILLMAGDPGLRSKFGHAGRQKVETEFSLQSMLENYSRLYTIRNLEHRVAGTALGRA